MNKRKALIFGYSGFVGPYLAKELLGDGYDIIGSDIAKKPIDNLLMNYFVADITNASQVNSLINKVKPDIVINLAAISSVAQSWKIPDVTMSVNVIGAINILQAASTLEKKPKILFVGSSEEYEASNDPIGVNNSLNSNNPYGISKITQERIAELYRHRFGMKIFCVRPFNHTGVGQKDSFVMPSFCKQVAEIEKSGKSGTIVVGNIEVYRDFSDVRDIVRAYKMILSTENDSIIYNVGSGKPYKISELLNYVVSLSSQNIEIVIDEKKFRPADTPFVCCDYSKIKEDLSWEPRFSIFDTIREMYNYYLSIV